MDCGTIGNLTTLEPQLSPMLWTSIATGKHAYHHGVPGFTEVDSKNRVVPVSAATRQCRTLWEMLGDRGLKSNVISWFATQGETTPGSSVVSSAYNSFPHKEDDEPEDWPSPPPGTYWPESLAEHLDTLRVSPWDMDGDAVMRLLVPDAAKIDQTKDRRLWQLACKLAEAFSAHAAACWLLENDPDWDFTAVYYRALDEICHLFMAYHPPKMEGIPEHDFELYRHVVNGAYRIHDLMLCRLIELAGEDIAIVLVSDHGFHCDHLRPKFTPRVPTGITVWHRPQGVFLAKGPGFKMDEIIYGARLLDITPTILTWFGLPVGEDMEGRVLLEAFAEKPEVESIPTWETTSAPPKQHPTMSDADNQALIDQFVELGYIDELPEDSSAAAEETNRENKWNMARALIDGGRLAQALPLLEEIYYLNPERTDYAQKLAGCQLRLGLLDEAEETIEECLKTYGDVSGAHLIQANIALERQQPQVALQHLEKIKEQKSDDVLYLTLMSLTLLRMRRWEACLEICRKLVVIDPHNVEGNLTLARCSIHLENYNDAVEFSLEAIGFQYGNPRGHFILGVALCHLENWEEASQALRVAINLDPHLFPAYRYLSRALRALNQDAAAEGAILTMRELEIPRKEEALPASRLREESSARVGKFVAQRRRNDEKLKRQKEEEEAQSALDPDQEFLLVSGLPRSGTSLMMQMLRAGGLEIMTDGKRIADEDNPEGYWEWEEIKKLPKQALVIEKAHGKAIKVVSALLPSLPIKHLYKIIFMRRPIDQVVSSQWLMMEHKGRQPKSERDYLERTQSDHEEKMLAKMKSSSRANVLEVDYPSLVKHPEEWVEKIAGFAGAPDFGKMAVCVRPDLFRNRSCVSTRQTIE